MGIDITTLALAKQYIKKSLKEADVKDLIYINLTDYGLVFGGDAVSVPQEFIDIIQNALDSHKAFYVHGSIYFSTMQGTTLLDTIYMQENIIVATGSSVFISNDYNETPAWFALVVNPANRLVVAKYGIIQTDEPGYSPTIDVFEGTDSITLTITDINGSQNVEIPKYKDNAVIIEEIEQIKETISALETKLTSGTIDNAMLHLGFYLDEDGDLCQKED